MARHSEATLTLHIGINPAGHHQPVPSCGEVVCFHCARIIWS